MRSVTAGDVPRIQPGRFGGGLSWTSEKLDASFLVLAVSAQKRIGVADSPTPGYSSVDAQKRTLDGKIDLQDEMSVQR